MVSARSIGIDLIPQNSHRLIPLGTIFEGRIVKTVSIGEFGGIVGQVSHGAIVYDAETTYGGSGGPVLNAQGEVVAINSAILPEYGGSNMGVPVRALKKLIAKVEAQN